jgi:hypothetical protein
MYQKKYIIIITSLTISILHFTLFTGSGFAQSKKDIRKNNVKTLTETITTFENGKETTRNDLIQKFDKKGQVIEETRYDKSGKFKEKVVTKYNNLDDKTEEIIYDANGKQHSREIYKYDAEGDKSEEWHYDDRNELVSKSFYTTKKGLRIERKTYDMKGKLIQSKKYEYQ